MSVTHDETLMRPEPSAPDVESALRYLRARSTDARKVLRGYRVLRGVDHGPLPRVTGRVIVRNDGTLRIGEKFKASGGFAPVRLQVSAGAELTIGDRASLQFGTDINAANRITIGDFARIAGHVTILDDSWHPLSPDRPRCGAPVTIGTNVWLGPRVIVLAGVTIGDHSVIGAGSVVTRDIPPRVLAVGSPARPVRELDVPDGWRRT